MHVRSLAVIFAVCGAACGPKSSPPEPPANVDAAPEATAGMLDAVQGSWQGTNTLVIVDPTKPELSDGTLEVEGNRVDYNWVFRGDPQGGSMTLTQDGDTVQVEWSDSWHAKDGLVSTGTFEDGMIRVVGTYPAGEGPDWSWRTELDVGDPAKLELRMYNIMPDGREQMAVQLRCTRGGADG